MSSKYTKADLKKIVMGQLENLNNVHDLISIMKHQDELIAISNKMLKKEISNYYKQRLYPTAWAFVTEWEGMVLDRG